MRTRAVWALRALWFLLPLTVGQAGSDAIASADHAVPFVMTAGLWILWAAGMVATMVPVPVTLTAIRVLAAGTIPLATWALVDTDAAAISILAIGHAAVLGLVALNSLVGDPLAPVVTALMVTGAAAGPLLLANKQWILGVIAMALGAGALAVGLRALNQMSQRWVIFVPTGMVIHDLTMMTEPVLFRRTAIERLGAAIAGSPARDLSNTAAGLLLECELTDPAPLGLRDGGGRSGATLTDVRRFLFCPSRPGDLLDEAERRNIPTD
jgi:hypothetical protein